MNLWVWGWEYEREWMCEWVCECVWALFKTLFTFLVELLWNNFSKIGKTSSPIKARARRALTLGKRERVCLWVYSTFDCECECMSWLRRREERLLYTIHSLILFHSLYISLSLCIVANTLPSSFFSLPPLHITHRTFPTFLFYLWIHLSIISKDI